MAVVASAVTGADSGGGAAAVFLWQPQTLVRARTSPSASTVPCQSVNGDLILAKPAVSMPVHALSEDWKIM